MSNQTARKKSYSASLSAIAAALTYLDLVADHADIEPAHLELVQNVTHQTRECFETLLEFYDGMYDKDPRTTSPGWISEN